MKTSYLQAEKNSRMRDIEMENNKHIDLYTIQEIEEKADEQGYILIKKKNKNQANFTQNVTDNLQIIIQNKYLTEAELSFLISIQPLVEYQINAIMNQETNSFMTVSEIAQFLKKDRSGVSRIISSLLNKGILFEFVNVREIKKFKRSVSARTLFVNPELFYSGDKNKIDGTLATLVNENDVLEDNGIKLKWKVYRKQGHAFGRLYNRKTFLELKKK